MTPSYYVLSRVPLMGCDSLLDHSNPKSLRAARERVQYLFLFLDAIQLSPDSVYARKSPDEIENQDDMADV
jgi:hypothetical protein